MTFVNILLAVALLGTITAYVFDILYKKRSKKYFDERCNTYFICSASLFIFSLTVCLISLTIKLLNLG